MKENELGIIEACLFGFGKALACSQIADILEVTEDKVAEYVDTLNKRYDEYSSGIQIIKIDNGYQMCTKEEYFRYIENLMDTRPRPNLSNQALEVLAVIAYNTGVTRAEIDSIRGVSSDSIVARLLDYDLIYIVGKKDAPGHPKMYAVTEEFFRVFGISSPEELPTLPKYRVDENRQIVIDDLLEEKEISNKEDLDGRDKDA